ncbi:MAG: isocitrate/isopropylmalate family dehydrogenase [Bradymonadia bacterium]
MSAKKVSLIPGDFLGRDLAGPVTELLAQAGAQVEWEWLEVPSKIDPEEGPVTQAWIDSIRANGVALKAPLRTPMSAGYRSPSYKLRTELDLYAGVRRCRTLKGLDTRYPDLDLVVIRENTEDVYGGHEHSVHPGVVESLKVVTRTATERIMRFGFRYARQTGRQKVAIIHKANIMKKADGLFLNTGLEVGQDYPNVETRGLIVDNTCMQLVQNPYQFDVLICGNLYGDIISDLCAGLVGGISAVWGVDMGEDCTMFEMLHGRLKQLAGTNKVNPMSMIMPGIHLVRHIGQGDVADRLQAAVETVMVEKKYLTEDLGGTATTSEMIAAITGALR